jgi:hypothetical protein
MPMKKPRMDPTRDPDPLAILKPEQRLEAERVLAEAIVHRDEGTNQEDAPLDVVENAQPYIFSPGAGPAGARISALDITEIALTLVIQLVGGDINGKGVLRRLAMRANFYETL